MTGLFIGYTDYALFARLL